MLSTLSEDTPLVKVLTRDAISSWNGGSDAQPFKRASETTG